MPAVGDPVNRPTHPPDQPAVRLDQVHKAFGGFSVLRGVSLDIEPGKTTVVIGPSGTGKSVLLKHVVGLLEPDRGEVWLEGQRVSQLSPKGLVEARKRVGFLFQTGALFDSMTVEQNVCFPLAEHTRIRAQEAAQRCARVLAMVGLDGVQRKFPSELSGGQRKRVALARAIVLEPSIVLYDEPTTGLDPIRSDVINELINDLRVEMGMTSIVVTHDMTSARKIADRVVMLYDGVIVADGDAASLDASEVEVVRRFVRGIAEPEDLEAIRAGFDRAAPAAQAAAT